jgi:hypothetical protein
MKENIKSTALEVIKFGQSKQVLPVESNPTNDDTYVTHGNDNLYPNYLLSLYGRSPIFASIINQKATFIEGGGLVDLATNKTLLDKPNSDDTWELFTDKVVKSFLIHNAYAVEVNFNAFGEPVMWNFVPYEKVRMNKSKTKVWICNDWSKKKDILVLDRYVDGRAYEDTKSKIFIYEGYIPSAVGGIYTLPEYYSLIKHLSTDIEITEFNHSNILNHFSVTTLINVYQNSDEATKRGFQKSLTDSYTGSEGNKFIVSFNPQSSNSKPTEITPLSSGDWTNKYEALKAQTHETIFLGMGIVNPSLFGYKSAGSLGNSQELENSYEILSKNVISVKRNELEAGLSELLKLNVSFLDLPLFNTTLSDDLKKSVLTIDEIRETAGLKPLPNGMGTMLIAAEKVSDTSFNTPQNKGISFSKSDEWEKVTTTEQQFDLIKDIGTSKDDFKLYEGNFSQAKLQFDDESDIANYLISEKLEGLSLADIKKGIREKLGINVSLEALRKYIDDVVETGLISVSKDNDKLTINPGTNLLEPVYKRKVETVYEYAKRPEASGKTKLDTTRPFCQKLIDANKFYTLEDIQSISRVLNYDVFIHTGGFWRKKGTEETEPHCRHYWKQKSVVRKPKDNL